MMLVFCVVMMLVFCGGFTGGTTSAASGRLLFANPNMHMIQRGIPRTLPQMGIVLSSLAAASLARCWTTYLSAAPPTETQ